MYSVIYRIGYAIHV